MSWLQSGLSWAYLFLCLVLVWYVVSVPVFVVQWLRRQTRFKTVIIAVAKFTLALLISRVVVWLGVHFT